MADDEPLFSPGRALWLGVAFVGSFLLIRELLQAIYTYVVRFNLTYYWPVSVFSLRPLSSWHVAVAAGALALFASAVSRVARSSYRRREVVIVGFALVCLSNLIQGWAEGIAAPVAYEARAGKFIPVSTAGEQYYHDALTITDPLEFVRQYTSVQMGLHQHSRTHPPGAVLLLYTLNRVFKAPWAIALALAALAVALSGWFLHALTVCVFRLNAGPFVTFLYLLSPVVQIYYLAAIDGVITGLLLAGVYFFLRPGTRAAAAAVLCLWLSSFLTFMSVFVLPIIAGFELVRKATLRRTLAIVGSVALIYVAIYAFLDYNYWASFRLVARYENPEGFHAFVRPLSYISTRLEDVGEIVLFFGPYLGALAVRRIRQSSIRTDADLLFALAVATLLAIFLSGAYRTGETARGCLYVFPYLMLPVAAYLSERHTSLRDQVLLAALVFVQGILMQLAGNFYW